MLPAEPWERESTVPISFLFHQKPSLELKISAVRRAFSKRYKRQFDSWLDTKRDIFDLTFRTFSSLRRRGTLHPGSSGRPTLAASPTTHELTYNIANRKRFHRHAHARARKDTVLYTQFSVNEGIIFFFHSQTSFSTWSASGRSVISTHWSPLSLSLCRHRGQVCRSSRPLSHLRESINEWMNKSINQSTNPVHPSYIIPGIVPNSPPSAPYQLSMHFSQYVWEQGRIIDDFLSMQMQHSIIASAPALEKEKSSSLWFFPQNPRCPATGYFINEQTKPQHHLF